MENTFENNYRKMRDTWSVLINEYDVTDYDELSGLINFIADACLALDTALDNPDREEVEMLELAEAELRSAAKKISWLYYHC